MGLPDPQQGIIDGVGRIRWRYAVPFTGQIPVFLVIPLPFSQRVDVSPSFDSSGGQREVTCRITANLNEFNTVDRLCTDAANVINPNASVPLGIAFHVHFIGGRIIAAQRRVERHQAIVSGIVAVNGQYIPPVSPFAIHLNRAAILGLPPIVVLATRSVPPCITFTSPAVVTFPDITPLLWILMC